MHQQLNAFNRIAVKETCEIIVAKVVWISQTIVTHFAGFPRFDAHRVGHVIQPFEPGVARREVADSCHRGVPGKHADISSAQDVLNTPVRKSILRLATQQ